MRFVVLTSLLLVTSLSCQPQNEIRTYTVERTSPPKEPFDTERITNQLDRILAGMLPIDDQVYFFKLSGKKPAVDRHRQAFRDFLGTVSRGNSKDDPVRWELPEGWTEKGQSEMRINTVVIPDESGALEIAVSSLPKAGEWESFVASNVNRWLDQLGQGALARQKIVNLTKKVETKAGSATVIELAGVLKETMPMNPHATLAERDTQETAAEDIAPPASSSQSLIAFEAPEGWQEGPAMPMREATYLVADGSQKAELTVSAWPAGEGSQMADVMANVQRWAAQVGMPASENLTELVEKIDIGGAQGSFVKLVGPDGDAGKAMLSAMVVRDEKVWFFKLMGDAALIEREGENFRKFLDSVRFK